MAKTTSMHSGTSEPRSNFTVVEHKVSVSVAVFTVISVTIGAGMVSVPKAAYESGIPWALAYNIFNLILSVYSIHLFLRSAQVTGHYSMPQLGYECFGHCSLYLVNFIQFLAFGLLPIAYFIVFAKLLKSFFDEIPWVEKHGQSTIGNQWFSVMILAVLIFPLIIKKKIQELKIAGILLVASVIIFIILMFLMRMINDSDLKRPPISNGDFYFFRFSKPWLSSLSTAFVAFAFQSAFFPIYNSLESKSYQNGIKFTFFGMLFCFVIYTMIIFVSLYSFGVDIQGDVLENVEGVRVWESYVLRAIFLLVMAAHTPFIFFIGKGSVIAIVALLYIRGGRQEEIDQSQIHYEYLDKKNQSEDKEGGGNEREQLLDENFSHDSNNPKKRRSTVRNMTISSMIISEGVERDISLAIPFSKKVKKPMVITGSALKSDVINELIPNWVYYTITLV